MKNRQAIILLFIANSISGCAQGISMIAVPWYFADVLDEPRIWGLLYAAVTFISLFWGLYAGTLVDRFNRKRLFLGENAVGGFLILSIAALGFYLGEVPMLMAGAVFAITFFIYNIHYPTLYAFVQEITEQKDYNRITSYLEIQGQLTYMIAGALGAILLSGIEAGPNELLGTTINMPFTVEPWELYEVFLMDGCTYVLSFLIISMISYQSLVKRKADQGSIIERLKVGIDFLKRNPLLFVFGNAAYFVFVTTLVSGLLLNPNFVSNFLKADGSVFALSELTFAFGAIISGISIQWFFRNRNILGCIIMTLLGALMLFIIGGTSSVAVFLIASMFQGTANSGARIMRVTYLFKRVPNQVIGRTFGVFQLINVLFRIVFISLFSLPFFIENISFAYYGFGLATVVAAVILIAYYRKLKDLVVR